MILPDALVEWAAVGLYRCREKAMRISRGIGEKAHDLALVVDPVGTSSYAARDIDSNKVPSGIQKPMSPSRGIIEASNNISSVIDARGRSVRAAGDGNHGKAHPIVYKSMCSQCVRYLETSYNLPCIINA